MPWGREDSPAAVLERAPPRICWGSGHKGGRWAREARCPGRFAVSLPGWLPTWPRGQPPVLVLRRLASLDSAQYDVVEDAGQISPTKCGTERFEPRTEGHLGGHRAAWGGGPPQADWCAKAAKKSLISKGTAGEKVWSSSEHIGPGGYNLMDLCDLCGLCVRGLA